MSRFPYLVLIFCFFVSFGFAQDSLKKADPEKKSAKPLLPPNKFHVFKYHTARTDSLAIKPAYSSTYAQKPDSAKPAPVIDKSINGQYQYLLTKVYHYQQPLISALWKSASDTITQNRRKLIAAENKLAIQSRIIDTLRADSTNNAQILSGSKGSEVNFIGINLPLSTYNIIVWGLIVLLGIATFVVIARSAGYRKEAQYRTALFTELEDDFKAFKAKANDKEKKLARELQTERNKLDELLGR